MYEEKLFQFKDHEKEIDSELEMKLQVETNMSALCVGAITALREMKKPEMQRVARLIEVMDRRLVDAKNALKAEREKDPNAQ